MRRTDTLAGLVAIGVLIGATLLTVWRYQPPAAAPETAEGFSATRAMATLGRLLPDNQPHPRGSEAQTAFQNRLLHELRGHGIQPEVQVAHACSPLGPCGEVRNIVVHFPGSSSQTVLVSAHTDSAPDSPGASDDGHGVAILVELARVLANQPHTNSVTLLFTDGEEEGLLGALAFLEGHPLAAQVAVAVNLEARGNAGISSLFRTAGEDAWLIDIYAKNAPRPTTSSVHQVVFDTMPHYTDLTAWDSVGIPGVDFAFIDGAEAYHSATDTVDQLDPRAVQSQGDNALAMVHGLLHADLLHPRRGYANWFDWMGLTVVWWPREWTFWGSLSWLLLLGVTTGAGVATGRLRMRALLRAVAVVIALLAFSLVPGWAALALLGSESSAPTLTLLALVLGTVLFHGAVGARLRPLRLLEIHLATCSITAACAVPIALFWPGLVHLLIAPGIVSLLGMLVALRRSAANAHAAPLLGLAVAALLWLPMLEGVRIALGISTAPLLTGGLGLVLLWGLPLWRGLPLPVRRAARAPVHLLGLRGLS